MRSREREVGMLMQISEQTSAMEVAMLTMITQQTTSKTC